MGAGEREVTLTVNGKSPPLLLGKGVGRREGERPKASWSQAVTQGTVISSGSCHHLQPWVHLVKSVSEPGADLRKDRGGFLATSLLLYLLRGLRPQSGS